MSFFSDVFGAAGCNPDGSLGQNAFTQFVDTSLDGHSMLATGQLSEQQHQQLMQEAIARQMAMQDAPETMNSGAHPPVEMMSTPMMNPSSEGMNMGMMMPSMIPPMMWSMQQIYAQQFVYQQQQQQQQQHFHQQQMMLQFQQAQKFLERQEQQQQQEEFGEDADIDVDQETLAEFMQSATIAEENNALNATSWTVADQETTTQRHPSTSTYASHHNPSFAAPMQQHSTEYTFEQDNPYAEHDEGVPLSALFEQGMRYYHSGHLQTAILSFEAILQRQNAVTGGRGEEEEENSFVSQSWRMLGLCHAENDQELNAIHCLQSALELDPYASDVLPVLATCLFNEQRSVDALETVRQFLQTSPLLASLEEETAALSTAETEVITSGLAESVKRDLGEVAGTLLGETLVLLHTALHKLRQETSMTSTSMASSIPSSSSSSSHQVSLSEVRVDCAVLQGVLYNIAMDFDRATSAFREALEMKPSDHSLLNKLAATLANSNRSEDAIPLYEQLLHQRPRYPRGWMNLGISHANLQQYPEAARAYIKALHLSPEARHIWGYLRVVLSCMERFDLVQMSGKEDALYEIAQALGVEDLAA
jgi:peroxin-5